MINKIKHFYKTHIDHILNFGHKGGTLALALVLLLGTTVSLTGCTNSQIQSDLQKVEALLPTVTGIAGSVAAIVAVADPAIAVPINAAMAIITASSSTVEAILKQYGTNLSTAPQSVIGQLDAAIAAIQTQLSTIQGLFPGLSSIVVAGLNIALTGILAILGYLANIVPAPVAAKFFPHAYAKLAGHVTFGNVGVIPSARQFAKDYNQKMRFAGHSEAQIHVPFPRVLGVPIPVLPRM